MVKDLSVPEVSPEDVHEATIQKSGVVILDVRTPEEYMRGHISSSKHLPLNTLAGHIETLIPDKQAVVYVYCFSGSRSHVAVQQMLDLGYSNVFHLPSGLLAWRQKGYTLTTK
jgi:rhodanese-related sulfurtransferase